MKFKVLFFFLFIVAAAYSQETVNLDVRGVVSNDDNGKKESGVKVSVVHNGKEIASANSATNGKFNMDVPIPAGATFTVVFSKPGFVSKRIGHSLAGINLEDLPSGNVMPIEANAGLFAVRENVDFSFLDTEPVAKFAFDSKKNAYTHDPSQASAMKTKIDNLLAQAENKAKENELKYNAAVKEADAKFAAKDYQAALNKYEEALGYKPKETYPSDKILELDALLQAQKKDALLDQQENAEYNNLITAADNLRDQKQYDKAIATYEQALEKKVEQYPKDQIQILKDEKKKIDNKKAYDEAITSADMFFKQKSLKASRDQYLAAQKLIPSEKYPGEQLAKIDKLLKDQEDVEAKKKKYEEAVAAADALYDQEKWEESKAKYQEAVSYESAATYPAGRITLIDQKLAELAKEKENAEKLANLLKSGQDNFTAEKYEEAKKNYTDVLAIEAENAIAKGRLSEIDLKIAEQKEFAAKNAEFLKLVADGDLADKGAKLDLAKTKYEAAIALRADADVQAKLDAVNKKIADQASAAENKKKYDALILEGTELFKANSLSEAKSKFEAAGALDETQKLPKDKIVEIDALLAKQKLAEEKAGQYQQLIDEGEAALTANDLTLARTKYAEAQKLDPAQALPAEKIKEIDKLIAANKSLKEKEEKYQAAITEASALLGDNKLSEAKLKFQAAQKIDPVQTLPAEKIAEIDALIAKNNQDAEAQALQAKYDGFMAEGDKLLAESKLTEARNKYSEAKKVLPSQSLPDVKIAEIDKLIADQKALADKEAEIKLLLADGQKALDKKDYTLAKAKYESVLDVDNANQQAVTKLAEVNKLISDQKSSAENDALFATLKQEGYALADQKKYQEAKNKLNEAIGIKADAEISKKIKAIDDAMAAEAELLSKDQKYNDLLTKAGNLENANDITAAIAAYKEASALKPAEQLPKDKITALNQQLSSMSAQQKIDENYNAAMKAGDKFMSEKNYLKAIEEFNKALSFKPTESLPVTKAKQAQDAIEAENNGQVNEQYEKIISVARQKINESDFVKATELIDRAEKLKPEDPRPAEMRKEVADLIAKEKAYITAMKDAGNLAASSKIELAIAKYEEAKMLKPTATEPQQKIDELNAKLASLNSAAENEAMYQSHMDKGASAFATTDYTAALASYKNALNVKKGDKAATDKIAEISQILDNLANEAKKNKANQAEIDKLIAAADKVFDAKRWIDAKTAYEKVLQKDPSNSYAQQRVNDAIANDKRETGVALEKEYQKIITVADNAFNVADYTKAKSYYERALTFKSTDPYPKQKLAEIDAILNPNVLANDALQPLGIPVDNSILDGGALLVQAELQRQHGDKEKVVNANREISQQESDLSSAKYEDSKNTSLKINEVMDGVNENIAADAIDQQENLEKLRYKENERLVLDQQNANYKSNEINNTNEKLIVTNTQIEVDREKNSNRYKVNTEVIDNEQKLQRIAREEKNNAASNKAYDTKDEITNIITSVETNNSDEDSRVKAKQSIEEKENNARSATSGYQRRCCAPRKSINSLSAGTFPPSWR